METTRQQKIARLVQKEMADMFQGDRALYGGHGMVTVTRASVSKDFSYARVYVSVFGVPDKAAVMALLESNSREIRFRLGQRVRQQLRIIPELTFVLDETLDYIENIDKLLKQ
jgi:ribosome-binding factor A